MARPHPTPTKTTRGEAAEIIEREIMQQHVIVNEIRKIDLEPYLEEAAHKVVWDRVGPQLRAIPLLGGFINDSMLAKFEVIAAASMKDEAGPLMEKVATQFEQSVDIKQLIEANIAAFDLERLEAIVNEVARREFRTIERLGAVLGFIIGCAQVGLFWATGSIQFCSPRLDPIPPIAPPPHTASVVPLSVATRRSIHRTPAK